MRVYRFSRLTKGAFLFSLLLLLTGIIAVYAYFGIHFGIDFESGLLLQYRIPGTVTVDAIESSLSDYPSLLVRRVGPDEEGLFLIRITGDENGALQSDAEVLIYETLSEQYGDDVSVEESAYVGPSLSQTLRGQTVLLIAGTLLLILAYLWFRFHIHFAAASIAALLHDVVFVVLFVGLTGIEVTAATIAAILTVIGYSLNDTIVVFDRIRENRLLMQNVSLQTTVDTSISQSLSRTIITSLTTMLAAAAIIIFATDTIRDFAMTLAFGVLIGTYSSIFIASPVYVWLQRREEGRKPRSSETLPRTSTLAPSTGDTPSHQTPPVDITALKREIGWKQRSAKAKKKKKR